MKKTVLFLLLFLPTLIGFAQDRPVISDAHVYHDQDTTVVFSTMYMDNDLFVEKMTRALGNPIINTPGDITWARIIIEGLKDKVHIHIKEGITTRNEEKRSECWSPFDGDADKQRKLAAMTGNQIREIKIEITDQAGKNIINSAEKEKIARDFLNHAFEKG